MPTGNAANLCSSSDGDLPYRPSGHNPVLERPDHLSDTNTPDTTFAALGVREPLVKALADKGITSPFPIQVDTLPDTLSGRDVLGRGKTGSGKTLAFSIPMVSRLAGELSGGKRRPGRPVGLILAPTRELATQITATLEPLAAAYDLRVTTIFGGVSQNRQVSASRRASTLSSRAPDGSKT